MKVKSCESHLKNIFAVRKQSAFFFSRSPINLKIIVRKLRMGITSAITVFLGKQKQNSEMHLFLRYNFCLYFVHDSFILERVSLASQTDYSTIEG